MQRKPEYCIITLTGKGSGFTLPAVIDPMSKPKKRAFSIVKAVKRNARDRVGQPPPERVIPDPKQKAAASPKHKQSLADLLAHDPDRA